MSDLTEARQQAQAALDKVMNSRFSNFDAGAVIRWVERGMYQVKPDLEAHKALNAARDAEIARLRDALSRQGDNMAFVLNHMTIPDQYYRKFTAELEEDRAAINAL